jgi:hypothetical protein
VAHRLQIKISISVVQTIIYCVYISQELNTVVEMTKDYSSVCCITTSKGVPSTCNIFEMPSMWIAINGGEQVNLIFLILGKHETES